MDNAAARAEIPGPVTLDPGPGSGNNGLDSLSTPAVGGEAWGTGDAPLKLCEGIGEARRAMDSARGAEVPYDGARNEP